MFQMSVEGTGF